MALILVIHYFDGGKVAGVDFRLLSPEAQGLAIRRRREIQEIITQLRMNTDPRQIPGLVNRVVNFYSMQAFTTKGDIPTSIIPDAARYDIETFVSGGIRVPGTTETGHEFIDIMTKAGKKEKATFAQFSIRGDRMLVSEEVAALYKASLGTFDLDDKGIPIMKTFKDENGKTRIAFTTLRDPKGYEEFIYMRANLNHAETLQGILGKKVETINEVQEMLGQDSFIEKVMAEAGTDRATAEKVFQRMKTVLHQKGGKFTYKSSLKEGALSANALFDESDLLTVETVLRLAKQQLLNGAELPSLQSASQIDIFEETARRRSASTTGRNALVMQDGVLRTAQMAENLEAEKGAKYFNKSFVTLATETTSDENILQKMTDSVNSAIGEIRSGFSITPDQLEAFVNGADDLGGLDRQTRLAIGTFGLEDFIAKSTFGGVGNVENSIGVLANRAATVYSLSGQLNDALEGLVSPDQLKAIQSKYAMGIIEQSNVVDLVKQLVGGTKLLSYSEAIAGKTDDEVARITSAYDAIVKRVNERNTEALGSRAVSVTRETIGKFELPDIMKSMMDQQFQLLGYTRAAQIAAGKAKEELVGLDPLALSERLTFPGDISILKQKMIEGTRAALDTTSGLAINDAQRSLINQELASLSAMTDAQFAESIGLKVGSEMFNRYASITQSRRRAQATQAAIEIESTFMSKSMRRASKPIAKAEYLTQVKQMFRVSGIAGNLQKIKNLERK